MKPVYCCFYTLDSIYEREAARLRRSLDRHGLEHDLRGIESRGSWAQNTGYTATFVARMLAAHPGRPVVYLDADAVVWRAPVLFDSLADYDIAVHYRRGHELLNGTLWIAPTAKANEVIERYRRFCEQDPACHNEQVMLDYAITETPGLRVFKLPASYCWIHDVMAKDLTAGEEPVLEHLQCSRESSGSELLPNRRRRLAEIADADAG